MGMDLTVYVGPFLEVVDCDEDVWDELFEDIEELLHEGRGEAGNEECSKYLIPNCDVDGIERQMCFREHDDLPVISLTPAEVQRELDCFKEHCSPLLALQGHDVVFRWGVVCDVS